jgi:signal transduction histidine kinase/DNA-binding response OmpR family regulator
MVIEAALQGEKILRGRWNQTLLIIALILTGVLVYLSVLLNAAHKETQNNIREDALWATYQLDREARRVLAASDALARDPTSAKKFEGLVIRYEILASRIRILSNSQYQDAFANSALFSSLLAKLRTRFSELDNSIDAGRKLASLYGTNASSFAGAMEDISKLCSHLLSQTNALAAQQRDESRQQFAALQQKLFAILLMLMCMLFGWIYKLRQDSVRQNEEMAQVAKRRDAVSSLLAAAEAGNRARSQFMATIGHEIRTPLNAIIGMSELMEVSELSEENREAHRVIRASGVALHEMINEILDYSKIENGKIDIHLTSVAVGPTVQDTLTIMRGRAQEKGIALNCNIDEVLWQRKAETDQVRLKQVLVNLIGNAVKFTDKGEVSITVNLREQDGEALLHFAIRDTGMGIDEEGCEKLFKPFSQVDDTISRRFGGTGLGLTICKQVIERMGGRIGVVSAIGQGSTFWFELPTSLQEPISRADAPQPLPAEEELGELKILLVEDNEFNRMVAIKMLSKLGQTAAIAVDGLKAVEICKSQKFDVIFMDVQMPEMDGVQAARHILQAGSLNADTMIYAMTANASDDDRNACFEVGMRAFLSKPVTIASLHKVLSMVSAEINADGNALACEPDEPVKIETSAIQFSTMSANNGVLNHVELERRQEMLQIFEQEEYQQMVDCFFKDAADLLRELAILADNDQAGRSRIMHALKGAALNAGFNSVADIASTPAHGLESQDLLTILSMRLKDIHYEMRRDSELSEQMFLRVAS